MNLNLGTSGWAYGSWKPGFFPTGLGAKSFLSYYASRFNSVEVNYTFASPHKLTPQLAAKWIESVPVGFRFSFKAPRRVTHTRERLQPSADLKAFLKSLRPFERSGHLGCVLFQLPPNVKCDSKLLRNFLRRWPSSVKAAFEFRHDSWFNDEVFELLRKANVALCIAESDDLQTPDLATAGHVYYRFRLAKYPPSVLKARAVAIAAHLRQGREVFAYQKHEESPVTPKRALSIKKSVEGMLLSPE